MRNSPCGRKYHFIYFKVLSLLPVCALKSPGCCAENIDIVFLGFLNCGFESGSRWRCFTIKCKFTWGCHFKDTEPVTRIKSERREGAAAAAAATATAAATTAAAAAAAAAAATAGGSSSSSSWQQQQQRCLKKLPGSGCGASSHCSPFFSSPQPGSTFWLRSDFWIKPWKPQTKFRFFIAFFIAHCQMFMIRILRIFRDKEIGKSCIWRNNTPKLHIPFCCCNYILAENLHCFLHFFHVTFFTGLYLEGWNLPGRMLRFKQCVN